MNNQIKCVLVGALSSLVLFFGNFFADLKQVSAVGQEFNFPSEWISDSVNADQYRNYFEALQNNPEFISTYPDDYVVMFSGISSDLISVFILEPNTFFSASNDYDFYTGKFSYNRIAPSVLNSYLFNTQSEILPNYNPNANYNCCGIEYDNNSSSWFFGGSYYYNGAYRVGGSAPAMAVFSGTNEHPFDPIIDPLYNAAYSLYVNESEFTQWLLNNGRYTEINNAMLSNHVSDTVGIFRKYGGNNSAFAKLLKQFFDLRNIGQGVSDYNVAISKIRELYREFEAERKQELLDKFYNRIDDTQNIKPDTTDTNNTLITNLSTDDIYTKLLRDILRSLIAMQNNLGDLLQTIINKLDGLDNTVNIVNDSGIDDIDFSSLYVYDSDSFEDDLNSFGTAIEEVQSVPMGYITDINQNSLMPENMLEDKNSLTVNIPTITGFTLGNNGSVYSTQTGTYVLRSVDYPWLDPVVQKIKRFASIILILGYLVHLRYRIPELIRGE